MSAAEVGVRVKWPTNPVGHVQYCNALESSPCLLPGVLMQNCLMLQDSFGNIFVEPGDLIIGDVFNVSKPNDAVYFGVNTVNMHVWI